MLFLIFLVEEKNQTNKTHHPQVIYFLSSCSHLFSLFFLSTHHTITPPPNPRCPLLLGSTLICPRLMISSCLCSFMLWLLPQFFSSSVNFVDSHRIFSYQLETRSDLKSLGEKKHLPSLSRIQSLIFSWSTMDTGNYYAMVVHDLDSTGKASLCRI